MLNIITNVSRPGTKDTAVDMALHHEAWLVFGTAAHGGRRPGEGATAGLPVPHGGALQGRGAPRRQKYEQGKKAQVVGEPHKHFGLGLLAGRGPSQLNDLGTELKRFETYAGLPVIVNFYEVPSDPEGPTTFVLGSKYLSFSVWKE